MNVLAEMIKTLFGTMRYPEVAEMIMSMTTTSELAYVLDMLGIKGTFPYDHKFFNPLREVDPSMKVFDSLTERGFYTLIIGPNLDRLIMRIRNLRIYWGVMERRYTSAIKLNGMNTIKIWIMSPHKDSGPMVREMRKEWLNLDNIVANSTDYTGFDEKLNKEILVQANRELIYPAGDNYSGMRGNDVINLTTNTKMPPVTGMQLYTFMPGMLLSDRHMDGFKTGSVGVSVHWTKGLFGDTESSQCANRFMYINSLREPLVARVSTVSKFAGEVISLATECI